jgi:hypothetical protein
MSRSSAPRRTRGRARRAADPAATAATAREKPSPAPSARLTRRRFIGLVSAASMAMLADPLGALAQTRRAVPKRASDVAPRRLTAAAQEEIRKQKAYAGQAVKAIMDFPLPSGSAPAFVFKPLKARIRR